MKRFITIFVSSLVLLSILSLLLSPKIANAYSLTDNSKVLYSESESKEKDDDNGNSSLIVGGSLLATGGIGAAVVTFNNSRRKMNEPSKTLDENGNEIKQ